MNPNLLANILHVALAQVSRNWSGSVNARKGAINATKAAVP